MIQTYGGIKTSLKEIDFKYIQDQTRIMWSRSVIKNMKKIVNVISSIHYEDFTYEGPYYFKIIKVNDLLARQMENEYNVSNVTIEEFHGYESVNVTKEHNDKFRKNFIKYNFFGGITFELLNDRYSEVNLHKYLDPTSDIDVQISLNNVFFVNLETIVAEKITREYDQSIYVYHSDKTLVYNDENGVLKINPFHNEITNFIYENLLINLNKLDLIFENSVPFEDDEYSEIDSQVKNDNLLYKSNTIGKSNAKLFSYIDGNLKTIRIQLVLKIKNRNLEIVDHFFEFLINDSLKYDDKSLDTKINILNIKDKIYNISSLNILFFDNLEAYKKRKHLIIATKEDKRHKAFNHIFRIIYLLDLIKKYPEMYDTISYNSKSYIRKVISDNLDNSYIFYVYVNGQNIYKKIDTKYILKAFERIFIKLMLNSVPSKYSNMLRNVRISEDDMYEALSNFFDLNSSSLRRFMINSPMNMDFNRIEQTEQTEQAEQNQPVCNIEMYRSRIRELENTLKQLETTLRQSSINESKLEPDERKIIAREIKQTEKDFEQNLEMFNVDEERQLKGGKSQKKYRKSQKKYRNKMRIKKYKNTKKTRRY